MVRKNSAASGSAEKIAMRAEESITKVWPPIVPSQEFFAEFGMVETQILRSPPPN
jgi:hypothetical protein